MKRDTTWPEGMVYILTAPFWMALAVVGFFLWLAWHGLSLGIRRAKLTHEFMEK